MRIGRRDAMSILALVAAMPITVAVLLIGCSSEPREGVSLVRTEEDQLALRLECNEVVVEPGISLDPNWAAQRAEEIGGQFGRTLLSAANEPHDCQRLLVGGNRQPFITLWIFDKLNTTDFSTPVNVAGIARRDRDYAPLKIQKLKSCVFLQESAGTSPQWKAWIVPIEVQDTCQVVDVANLKEADRLDVYPLKEGIGPSNKSNPVGGRIEDAGSDYYIGLRCKNLWCLIVPKNVNPFDFGGAKHAWGDEQRLSVTEKDGGPLVTTGIRARIQPVANLGDLDHEKYFEADYVRVATIQFTGGSAPHRQRAAIKFKLVDTTDIPLVVDVYLWHDKSVGIDQGWKIRYGPNGYPHDARWFNAKHSGYGTVRFRWSEKDEGVWIQCPAGCCGEDW